MTAEIRRLGRQGLAVSSIGLGCMGMTGSYGDSGEDESIATIQKAIELGVDMFDTADSYDSFANEKLLGKAVVGRRATPPDSPSRGCSAKDPTSSPSLAPGGSLTCLPTSTRRGRRLTTTRCARCGRPSPSKQSLATAFLRPTRASSANSAYHAVRAGRGRTGHQPIVRTTAFRRGGRDGQVGYSPQDTPTRPPSRWILN